MGAPPSAFLNQNKAILLRFLIILLLGSVPEKANLCSNLSLASPSVLLPGTSSTIPSLKTISLDGYFRFDSIDYAARDFGNRYRFLPSAVLYPKYVSDISTTIKHLFEMGTASQLTVAARGRGHSLQGQAQAPQGIVIDMESLEGPDMQVHTGKKPYVDVSGGALWIDLLRETLKYELAPKSWTDYLHLSVGGTLSNAGISGQAFQHGPQIDNVYQLEVVTGKGEVITCSRKRNAQLFYGVLGGLGQFGIITRARISLEPAPKMVKWMRVLYSEFSRFSNDQEFLLSLKNSFDYIEGFVIINKTGLVNNWSATLAPRDPIQASNFISDGRTLYCLEIAKYVDHEQYDVMNQNIENLLSGLSYIPSTLFESELPYLEFLDRVHVSEKKLRAKGLWEVPHPWVNLMIPKRKILEFAREVFGNILTGSRNGPILVYPVNKSKWNNRTSLITPEEDTFYLVAILSSVVPSSGVGDDLELMLDQNKRILDFCSASGIGAKQYLPYYTTREEWQAHFGPRWEVFARRKLTYDPLAILAPGQRVFHRNELLETQTTFGKAA